MVEMPRDEKSPGIRTEKQGLALQSNENPYGGSMTKSEIITRMALEAEGSELLTAVAEVIAGKSGEEKNERLYTITEISRAINYDVTWLRRLEVHTRCAIRLGGGKRYRLKDVLDYMQSAACQERVAELRELRKQR